jgi:hypothetical protein
VLLNLLKCSAEHLWIHSENVTQRCIKRGIYDFHYCCKNDKVYAFKTNMTFTHENGSMHNIFEPIRNKHITIIGDSLSRQTYDYLLISLELEGIHYKEKIDTYLYDENENFKIIPRMCNFENEKTECLNPQNWTDSAICKCTSVYQSYIPSYNVSLSLILGFRYQIPTEYIKLEEQNKQNNGGFFKVIGYKLVQHYTEISDSVFLNVGVHYDSAPAYMFAQYVLFFKKILKNDMKKNPLKKHMYRLTFPSHFGWNGLFESWTAVPNCSVNTDYHWTALAAIGLLQNEIHIIDYTAVLKSRGDLHSIKNPLDCLHRSE